jgi:transcriptional regulator with XRE-family HTH domain
MSSEINEFLTSMGLRLKEARRKSGKTQAEIASHLGIGKNAISRYERGDVEPGAMALSMLSCYLNVSIDWLLHGDDHRVAEETTPAYSGWPTDDARVAIHISAIAVQALEELKLIPEGAGLSEINERFSADQQVALFKTAKRYKMSVEDLKWFICLSFMFVEGKEVAPLDSIYP